MTSSFFLLVFFLLIASNISSRSFYFSLFKSDILCPLAAISANWSMRAIGFIYCYLAYKLWCCTSKRDPSSAGLYFIWTWWVILRLAFFIFWLISLPKKPSSSCISCYFLELNKLDFVSSHSKLLSESPSLIISIWPFF